MSGEGELSVTPFCWCGGRVGPRTPGDEVGLGCLEDINHDWTAGAPEAVEYQRRVHDRVVVRQERERIMGIFDAMIKNWSGPSAAAFAAAFRAEVNETWDLNQQD